METKDDFRDENFSFGENLLYLVVILDIKSLAAHGVHVCDMYSARNGCYATPPRSLLA